MDAQGSDASSGPYEDGTRALVTGRLSEAQELLGAAVAERPDWGEACRALGLAFYRANDFARAADAYARLPDMESVVAQLLSFGDETPYEHEPASAVLPFLLTDPLPVVAIRVNGDEIFALIDTGGGQLILDSEFASQRGVTSFGETRGTFGGGLHAPVGHGRVAGVGLGGIELRHVPVHLLPTRRFSPITGGRYQLDAILGTNVLAQFRSTLDYPGGELRLQPPRAERVEGVRVPFELHGDHYMIAAGSLNGTDGLRFFVDSGLAGGAFMCSERMLQKAGMAVPEARVQEASVGGGGGRFETGVFEIAELGLGPLRQHDLRGIYSPVFPAEGLAAVDGLISHGFLRHYRWTIDFEASLYLFA